MLYARSVERTDRDRPTMKRFFERSKVFMNVHRKTFYNAAETIRKIHVEKKHTRLNKNIRKLDLLSIVYLYNFIKMINLISL